MVESKIRSHGIDFCVRIATHHVPFRCAVMNSSVLEEAFL